jgi:hypothetical protein
MDAHHFDFLARSLTDASSRRGVLRGLAAATLGLAAISLPGEAEGRKKRKKRKKGKRNKKKTKGANPPALQLNDFQCVDVGNACRGNSANCCSGICEGKKPREGKKDRSRCIAHNVGICQPEQDICVDDLTANCGGAGRCFRTTGNASFCGNEGEGVCAVCARDADCEADFGPGAACIVCSTCEIKAGTSTACVPPAA